MDLADELERHSRDFAQRFLQTAVVVDDEAYMALDGIDGPRAEVVTPGRRTLPSNSDDQVSVGRETRLTLDAGSIVESFSVLGIICGVVGPKDSAMAAMRKADIVVLDWLLQGGEPQYTLQLLRDLLGGEADRNSLRLVVMYTGEARLQEICETVVAELKSAGLEPVANEFKTEIPYRHGRVVIYAKSSVNLAGDLKDRSVSETELPRKLVGDFASMTSGLLPSIALASLTAVREGEHKVLDRFRAELDPAFLGHRACLPSPEDAEGQIVNHVAEELRGLMDNAVAKESPASASAVENWIRRKGGDSRSFVFGGKELDLEQTITLANEGLKASTLKNNAFEDLTAGFSGGEGVELDEKLAWIMSFRTVYNLPRPILWLGSVVTELSDGDERHLICMRPRCDCVRLKEKTSFFFLPLVDVGADAGDVKPPKTEEQVVVEIDGKFKRLGIQFDLAGWVLLEFSPEKEGGEVTAAPPEGDGRSEFEFKDVDDKPYRWRGELEAQYAQRIAQNFANKLSRPAIDESEWLRRMARKG